MSDIVYDGTFADMRRIYNIWYMIIGNDVCTLGLQVIMARALELVFYGFKLQEGGQRYKRLYGVEISKVGTRQGLKEQKFYILFFFLLPFILNINICLFIGVNVGQLAPEIVFQILLFHRYIPLPYIYGSLLDYCIHFPPPYILSRNLLTF